MLMKCHDCYKRICYDGSDVDVDVGVGVGAGVCDIWRLFSRCCAVRCTISIFHGNGNDNGTIVSFH